MGPEYFWMSGMWIFPLMMIVLIYLLFGRTNFKNLFDGKDSSSINKETALDILKKRYAKGEITKSEFEEMKNSIL